MTRGAVVAIAALGLACAPATPAGRALPARDEGVLERRVSALEGARVELLRAGAGRNAAAPLAIVLDGGRDYPNEDARPAFLARAGADVAWIRFALGEGYSLEACTRDVSGFVHELARRAHAGVVLVGRGLGATMAARLALAPDRDPSISRIVITNGLYDLSDSAIVGIPDESLLRGTPSPAPRADAPPVLLLADSDDARFAQAARRFARALERAGAKAVESYVAPEGDRTAVDALVASFVLEGARERSLDGPWGVQQRWGRAPPLEHEVLWSWPNLAPQPVTGEVHVALTLVFGEPKRELQPWPLHTYQAIPLAEWLASRAESDVGRGEHLVVTNLRGEQLYLRRADLARHAPVLVIGLDDERNLYRLTTSYRLAREASWLPQHDAMPVMVRPVGPFLFFPHGTPPELDDTTLAGFGLSPASFRFTSADPLASARRVASPELRDALIGSHGCLKCHSLRGEGARAHHVRARDGAAHGGFALPLEEYARDVLRRFLFDQEAVAKSFGVTPLPLPEPVARALFELVPHAP